MLPDVLEYKLKAAFCGTAVGHKSARASACYVGPGNKFWKILYEIGFTPRVLRPKEYSTLLQLRRGADRPREDEVGWRFGSC